MMIWNFTNGWQKTIYKQVNAALILAGLLLNMSYASEQQRVTETDDAPSLELLDLLGQFEQQDETWFDNEVNKVSPDASESITDDKVND